MAKSAKEQLTNILKYNTKKVPDNIAENLANAISNNKSKYVSGSSNYMLMLSVSDNEIWAFKKIQPNSGINESNAIKVKCRYLRVYGYQYQQDTGVSWYKILVSGNKKGVHTYKGTSGSHSEYNGYYGPFKKDQEDYYWVPSGTFEGEKFNLEICEVDANLTSYNTIEQFRGEIITSSGSSNNSGGSSSSSGSSNNSGGSSSSSGSSNNSGGSSSSSSSSNNSGGSNSNGNNNNNSNNANGGTSNTNGTSGTTTSITDEFVDAFKSLKYEDDKKYFEDLYYFQKQTFSAKSFNSIVGMPVQFMSNVDLRYGSSTFGKQYTEDILYDAPIAVVHAGSPSLADSSFYTGDATGLKELLDGIIKTFSWMGALKEGGTGDKLKKFLTDWVVGGYNRFYDFQSEYSRYIQYVNTLCHLFASFLGISNRTVPGTDTKYRNYSDAIDDVEFDKGISMKMRYGNYPAVFIYYQPDSSISQTFTNLTQESSLTSKLNEVSNVTKEMSFLAGTLGFPGKGVTVGADVDSSSLFGLASTQYSFGNNLLQRIFAKTSEGVATIVGGSNLTLPEIYSNSSMTGTDYTLNIKLVNPYGTPEAAFLFQMRQLARLLALSLPRQYGPNGYTAPFIIRAFSKGQFNIQLGIVESLVIRRAGQGGENQTVHDIPMELDVTMTIKDLYQQIAISNEYGTSKDGLPVLRAEKTLKLLFNNIGLLDFVASYAGYNMNQPAIDMQFDYLRDTMYNQLTDIVDFNGTMSIKEWKYPMMNRMMLDSFYNAVETGSTFLAH